MRDATGEAPERLGLLGVPQRFLETLALGDVDEVALDELRLAGVVEHRDRLVVDPDDLAVPAVRGGSRG